LYRAQWSTVEWNLRHGLWKVYGRNTCMHEQSRQSIDTDIVQFSSTTTILIIQPSFKWPRCNLYIILWANKWWRWYILAKQVECCRPGPNDCSDISAYRGEHNSKQYGSPPGTHRTNIERDCTRQAKCMALAVIHGVSKRSGGTKEYKRSYGASSLKAWANLWPLAPFLSLHRLLACMQLTLQEHPIAMKNVVPAVGQMSWPLVTDCRPWNRAPPLLRRVLSSPCWWRKRLKSVCAQWKLERGPEKVSLLIIAITLSILPNNLHNFLAHGSSVSMMMMMMMMM